MADEWRIDGGSGETAFPATARSFEALPHNVALTINGCKVLPPHKPTARQDFERHADHKASHSLAGRSLLAHERPILVQEQTTCGATGIGKRTVDYQGLQSVGGKAPEQDTRATHP